MQRVLGGLGTVLGSWLAYPATLGERDAEETIPLRTGEARQLLAEAAIPTASR